jgi:hypothetical protein
MPCLYPICGGPRLPGLYAKVSGLRGDTAACKNAALRHIADKPARCNAIFLNPKEFA